MDKEQLLAILKKHADDLRVRIKGGNLYGSPVDMSNQDALICAAYLIGKWDGESHYTKPEKLVSTRLIEVLNAVRNRGER